MPERLRAPFVWADTLNRALCLARHTASSIEVGHLAPTPRGALHACAHESRRARYGS